MRIPSPEPLSSFTLPTLSHPRQLLGARAVVGQSEGRVEPCVHPFLKPQSPGHRTLPLHSALGSWKVEPDAWAGGGGVVSFLSPEACKWKVADCSQECCWEEVRLSPYNPVGQQEEKRHQSRSFCVPSPLNVPSHRLCTVVLGGRYYHCPHVGDDETESQRSEL